MKQFIRSIRIVFLFGLFPFPALAQESYTIDSVTVTATRVPVALHSSARIVTLMDSVAIATSPAETVNDLLKYALGVDVRQRGAMGMQTDISIRGGTYNQVAVLLDGINITDPQTGHNSVDFPVNLCDIERIEVLEGPAARVYGTSSLLGAINIVTKRKPMMPFRPSWKAVPSFPWAPTLLPPSGTAADSTGSRRAISAATDSATMPPEASTAISVPSRHPGRAATISAPETFRGKQVSAGKISVRALSTAPRSTTSSSIP